MEVECPGDIRGERSGYFHPYFALYGGVPVVLDGVVGATGEILGDERPLIAESALQTSYF